MENMEILEAALPTFELESCDYLAEYDRRKEAGRVGPLDRANAALRTAEQAVVVLAGDREGTPEERILEVVSQFRLARLFAGRAGKLAQAGDEEAAMLEAARVEAIVSHMRASEPARFDGHKVFEPSVPFEDERKGAVKTGRAG